MRTTIFLFCQVSLVLLFNGWIHADIQRECQKFCRKTRKMQSSQGTASGSLWNDFQCIQKCHKAMMKKHDAVQQVLQRRKRFISTMAPSPIKAIPTIILQLSDTWPPNLIPPSEGPTVPPRETGKCQAALQNLGGQDDDITNLRATCEGERNKRVRAQWSMPRLQEEDIDAFQIFYQILQIDIDNPFYSCMQAGKELRDIKLNISDVTNNTVIKLSVGVYKDRVLRNTAPVTFKPCYKEEAASPLCKPEKTNYPLLIGVGMALAVLVAGIAVIIFRWKMKPKKSYELDQNGPSALLSHCCESEDEVHKLLTFANRIQSMYGIACIVDILHEREMETLTEAVWRNKMYTKAKKMVILISKKYLEAFNNYLNDPQKDWSQDLHRVRVISDMTYVQNHLMTSGCTNKIICVLMDGLKRNDLPCFLQERAVFEYPTPFSDEEKDLVRCIMDMETRVLVVEQRLLNGTS